MKSRATRNPCFFFYDDFKYIRYLKFGRIFQACRAELTCFTAGKDQADIVVAVEPIFEYYNFDVAMLMFGFLEAYAVFNLEPINST